MNKVEYLGLQIENELKKKEDEILKKFEEYLKNNYYPKDISICVLLDKKCKRKVDVPVDYVGKEIGDAFIVGYGLDYDEFFRNEKEIFIPTKEQIEEIDKLNN